MLKVIDNQWKDHLLSMDHLKEGIGIRAYGQKDPLVEYKKESYELFQDMMDRIEDETIRYLFFLQVNTGTRPGAAVPRTKTRKKRRGRSRRVPTRPSSSAWRRNPPWRISRATSSARRRRNWPQLQFVGGDGSTTAQQAVAGAEGGPQRPMPLRQRQEVQEVPRFVTKRRCRSGAESL